jgi:hypothetical protein
MIAASAPEGRPAYTLALQMTVTARTVLYAAPTKTADRDELVSHLQLTESVHRRLCVDRSGE